MSIEDIKKAIESYERTMRFYKLEHYGDSEHKAGVIGSLEKRIKELEELLLGSR